MLFRIGNLEVTSFGVLVAAGFMVGLWLMQRELRWSGLPENATDAGLAGMVGGLVGAKLVWAIEHSGTGPLADLIFSRGGMSWYGGLAGGLAAGLLLLALRGLPLLPIVAAATPGIAVGHAIGRIGCFLVGDDYGLPSDLPWAVAFPEGLPPTTVPVHPTQLYEAAGLLVIAGLLVRWRRLRRPASFVLGAYLVLAGGLRFAIQFLRVHDPLLFGLGVAHLASFAAVIAGIGFILRSRASD